jgi:hypothetical protein
MNGTLNAAAALLAGAWQWPGSGHNSIQIASCSRGCPRLIQDANSLDITFSGTRLHSVHGVSFDTPDAAEKHWHCDCDLPHRPHKPCDPRLRGA